MNLPIEIILYEILPKTSLETIACCRMVSKAINKGTYDNFFCQLFYRKANISSGIHVLSLRHSVHHTRFIPVHSSTQLSLTSFLPSNVCVEAATKQGLLLCTSTAYSKNLIPKYMVCKPTTKQWRAIPNPKTRYFTQRCMMLTTGSKPLRYKIVRFSSRNYGGDSIQVKFEIQNAFRCEVFDSKFWRWRLLDESISVPYPEVIDFESMICISRYLYALTSDTRLFVYDVERETWEFCKLDFDGVYNNNIRARYQLLECEGKLGVRLLTDDDSYNSMQLWILKNDQPWSWGLRKDENFGVLNTKSDRASLVNFFHNDLAVILGFNTFWKDQYFQTESDWMPVVL